MKLRESIGIETCDLLLLAHSFLGCDTNSKPFGIGKGVGLKLIKGNAIFKEHAKKFYKSDASRGEIEMSGEIFMVITYGGDSTESIDTFRYKMLERKVATATSFVNPQDIPPTAGAMKAHSQRTYHQVGYSRGITYPF